MTDVSGQWDCVIKSPMGEQKSLLSMTVAPDGTVTGSNSGPLGAVDLTEGTFADDKLHFVMAVTAPIAMKLTCDATVAGDAITGKVAAGVFGSFPITASRKS